MIAIEVKYLPATNTKPRRICAFTVNGQRLVMSASLAEDRSGDSGNGQRAARYVAQSLADENQFGELRDWGGTVDGFVFCFPDKLETNQRGDLPIPDWFGVNVPLHLPSGQIVDSGITLDDYESRVSALESEGCDRSDAQGIVDAQLLQSHKG